MVDLLTTHETSSNKAAGASLAERKLARLVEIGLALSAETDRQALFRRILDGAKDISGCAAATLFLRNEANVLEFAMRTNDDSPLPAGGIPMFCPDGSPNDRYVVTHCALHREAVLIDDVYSETRFDLSGTKEFSERSGFRTVSILTAPMTLGDGEVVGVLQLLNAIDPASGRVVPFPPELMSFTQALASQAAVALENQKLLDAQRAVFDAFIKLIADAVDAKSAHTGGHCARVPQLAIMLAEEMAKVEHGPLAGLGFKTAEEWREFEIGAWLHDCGKVTTPEFVVDKAVRLETIHNRLHEVRTRFEILLRDAEIERLQALSAGTSPQEADGAYATLKAQLEADFAFLAACNSGERMMSEADKQRVRDIGARTWVRHFDDRIGLSAAEAERAAREPPATLPAVESLLADKPRHVTPRPASDRLDPRFGFKVSPPKNLYDFGEIHNLTISRGTLTEEERFKINEHIIQTIVMLETLPLPKHLRRIPEYAGTHHETLGGAGYPRRLGAAQLSAPARIMAIADIFEALTAADRPYKPAKTLSQSVEILADFKRRGHIDPDLFDLFLTSGVYRRYGERFLGPEQVDEVDVAAYLG